MRRLSLGLVVVLLVWCVATLEGKADTVQWSGNGHWYEAVYVPERITWLNASATATGSGGYLATILSSAENDFVYGLITDPKFWIVGPPRTLGPWIGGTDAEHDRT
jgi:hypothetical protein